MRAKNTVKNTVVWFIAVLMVMSMAGQVFAIAGATTATAPDSASSLLEKDNAVSISLLNQDPDPALAGNTFDVRLGITNLGGGAVNNLVIQAVPSYPFELVPGNNATQEIDTLNAYQGVYDASSQVVKFNLMIDKDAIAGTYNLNVLNYVDGSSVKTESSFPIQITSTQSAEIIHIDKTVLVPGQQSGLTFTINNVGSAPLRDLSFYWEETNNVILPVGSDNTQYIKYIDVGKSADVQYQVIADTNAAPGLYKLNLHLNYLDPITNTQKTISTIAGVYVGGVTDFDVAYSQSSSGQVSFSVANVGSNPAYSVSVIVPSQRGWTVSGSNSMIVGNLNKGDYTVASFSLQSTASSAGNFSRAGGGTARSTGTQAAGAQAAYQRAANNSTGYSGTGSPGVVLMQIAYTDTMGNRNVIEKNVTVGLQNSGLASAGTTTGTTRNFRTQQNPWTSVLTYGGYILIAAVLVGCFFVYRKYKKEKLTDPRFKLMDLLKKGGKKK